MELHQQCPNCGTDLTTRLAVKYMDNKAFCSLCNHMVLELKMSEAPSEPPTENREEFDLPSPEKKLKVFHFVVLLMLGAGVLLVNADFYRFLLIVASLVWTALIWKPWQHRETPLATMAKNILYYYAISAVAAAGCVAVGFFAYRLGTFSIAYYASSGDTKSQDTAAQQAIIENSHHTGVKRSHKKPKKHGATPSRQTGQPGDQKANQGADRRPPPPAS